MKWGNTVRRVRSAWTYEETHRAAAWSAGQLPAACVVWWVLAESGRDDHGVGYGGAFGLACLFVFAPLYLPVLGLLHTVLHIAPAGVLARTAPARRLPAPGWLRHLVAVALLGTGWAVLAARATGADFGVTAVAFASLGVLPVLAAARRGRGTEPELPEWGCWGTWFAAGGAGVVLAGAAVGGLALAARAGLVEEYEPPVLTAAQLTGGWRGAGGAVLRLEPGGRAVLTRVPAESGSGDDWADGSFPRCDGTGTWRLDRDGPDDDLGSGPGTRDAVVVRAQGCGRDTYWTIGGTARAPELFVLFGDPDAGDLRVLTRTETA
ncbi:hypothetical protein AB0G32_01435 [Streptomyces sp. NPDC023723]|uniref:hypothetical protein n=1 Tax=Streptomyces sp. NPDC023723 TaxID=3154323 RepID=UPI0033D23802